ncbi:UNVERIFIED_CONTAM: ndufa2, NADH:ubiquinone oxidoreductase 10.5kD subunit [Gekko kuhli]
MAAGLAARVIGSHLKEIRIHLCQRSPGSQGVRDFIEKQYVPLKKANPEFPILIRECSDVQPKLWARYGELRSAFLLVFTSVSVAVASQVAQTSVFQSSGKL